MELPTIPSMREERGTALREQQGQKARASRRRSKDKPGRSQIYRVFRTKSCVRQTPAQLFSWLCLKNNSIVLQVFTRSTSSRTAPKAGLPARPGGKRAFCCVLSMGSTGRPQRERLPASFVVLRTHRRRWRTVYTGVFCRRGICSHCSFVVGS